MVTLTPEAFIKRFCLDFPVLDHHYTGPPSNQQPPGCGSVFHIEGKILAGLAAKIGGPILEVGADQGVSTRYLHEGLLRYPSAGRTRIYSVDNNHKWNDDPSWPRRERICGNSQAYEPPIPCRLAFIDGDHRYESVCLDIINAVERCKITKLLFHDTGAHFVGKPTDASNGSEARRAVLVALESADWDVFDIATPCGMIYAVKKEFAPPCSAFMDPSATVGGCCDGVAR